MTDAASGAAAPASTSCTRAARARGPGWELLHGPRDVERWLGVVLDGAEVRARPARRGAEPGRSGTRSPRLAFAAVRGRGGAGRGRRGRQRRRAPAAARAAARRGERLSGDRHGRRSPRSRATRSTCSAARWPARVRVCAADELRALLRRHVAPRAAALVLDGAVREPGEGPGVPRALAAAPPTAARRGRTARPARSARGRASPTPARARRRSPRRGGARDRAPAGSGGSPWSPGTCTPREVQHELVAARQRRARGGACTRRRRRRRRARRDGSNDLRTLWSFDTPPSPVLGPKSDLPGIGIGQRACASLHGMTTTALETVAHWIGGERSQRPRATAR